MCAFEYTLIVLCKSEHLSVNLGNRGVYSSYREPGAVAIYHCRITAAPTSACSVTHGLSFTPQRHGAANHTGGAAEGSTNNEPTEITAVKVYRARRQRIARDYSIFFWRQCNTTHVSIAFTWMFRLANSLQTLSRWRRCHCSYKSPNKQLFLNKKKWMRNSVLKEQQRHEGFINVPMFYFQMQQKRVS